MYYCIKLSKEMQARVMNVFNAFFTIPEGWTKHCDHITLVHSSHTSWYPISDVLENFVGHSLEFRITGVGLGENVMALKVSTYSTNKVSHITICTAPDHVPAEANHIEKWQKLYCADVFYGTLSLEQ